MQSRRLEVGQTYYPYIDGLRGVSILAVVVFHLQPSLLPGGFSGVDVFFVVSGFVISGSLHGKRFSGLLDLIVLFYARRFRRIVPALLFTLIFTSVLAVLFIPHGFASSGDFRRIASAAFLGFSNIRLASSLDYFFPLAEFNPFTHTWSLAVEEQFYLVFPLIYLLIARTRTAKIATGTLLAICIASFAYGWYEPHLTVNLGFYSSLARFWEIGSGVLLYALFVQLGRYQPKPRPEGWLLSYIGVVLLFAAFVHAMPRTYPVPGALLPVLGTLCILVSLHGRTPNSIIATILTSGSLVWIGQLSYSLYLWHWPVFSLFRWTIGFSEIWQKCLALLVTMLLAISSYLYVETPLRRSSSIQAPLRSIPIFLVVIALSWWGADRIFANVKHISLSVVNRDRGDWFGAPDARSGTCRVEARPLELVGEHHQTFTPTDCGASAAPALFVIGDSHALSYQTMLIEYARRTGATVRLYYAACGFPKTFLPRGDCSRIDHAIIADVRERAALGDVLFLPSLRVPRFVEQWDSQAHDTGAEWRDGRRNFGPSVDTAAAMLRSIAPPGVRIVFEHPKPIFKIPLYRCADWFNRLNPACSSGSELDRATLLDYREPMIAFAESLQLRLGNFSTWDPFPLLCPAPVCSMWLNGKPLFFDGDHPTSLANTLLVDDFIAVIIRASRRSPTG